MLEALAVIPSSATPLQTYFGCISSLLAPLQNSSCETVNAATVFKAFVSVFFNRTGPAAHIPKSTPMRNIKTKPEEVVIEEPAVNKRIVSVIAALGVIATGLGVAAEVTRTKVRSSPSPLRPVRSFISNY